MKHPLSSLASLFWKIVGNTKIFKYPLWFVYDPEDPKVDGLHLSLAMNTLQPGDILLRGWRHYLSSSFIPGDYSHGGIYLGNNQVIHAVPPHVVQCHVLDFLMADRICLLRPSNGQSIALQRATSFLSSKTPYDPAMTEGTDALYCFELCAECYKDSLNLQKVTPSLLGGLINRKEPAWLAQSFLDSPNFSKLMEYNPDKNIDLKPNSYPL